MADGTGGKAILERTVLDELTVLQDAPEAVARDQHSIDVATPQGEAGDGLDLGRIHLGGQVTNLRGDASELAPATPVDKDESDGAEAGASRRAPSAQIAEIEPAAGAVAREGDGHALHEDEGARRRSGDDGDVVTAPEAL